MANGSWIRPHGQQRARVWDRAFICSGLVHHSLRNHQVLSICDSSGTYRVNQARHNQMCYLDVTPARHEGTRIIVFE